MPKWQELLHLEETFAGEFYIIMNYAIFTIKDISIINIPHQKEQFKLSDLLTKSGQQTKQEWAVTCIMKFLN